MTKTIVDFNPHALPSLKGNIELLSAETRLARQDTPVALVSMPFVSSQYPSIQLGILTALGQSTWISCRKSFI